MKCSTRPKTSLARARRVYGCRSRMVARVTVLSSRLQMAGIVQGVAAAIAAAALTAAALAAAEPAAAEHTTDRNHRIRHGLQLLGGRHSHLSRSP